MIRNQAASTMSPALKRPVSFQLTDRAYRAGRADQTEKKNRGIARTRAYKDNLRARYVEQLHHYIGVPYAKRYLEPGDELYDSPLFLDCCALVARGVSDLNFDFGFILGRGN